MDPRPYHFDYRRPRPNNPTYQSNHFHQSLQQLQAPLSKTSANPELHLPSLPLTSDPPTLKRVHSIDLNSSKGLEQETSASKAGYASVQKFGKALAGYGRNVLGVPSSQRYQIFQKQSHDYDIISYGPRSVRPTLRRFPKLTLEDKLIEFGLYPKKSE